jgi:16S rRNA (guanine527-N7)-methyltransferase
MAILRPDVHVSLADSVGKRAKVLDELVSQLNLSVSVYAARGEDLLEDFQFQTVTARAVGSLRKLCEWLQPHFDDIERLLVLKGPRWLDERGEARHHGALNGLELRKRVGYPLVGADGEGVILEIWKPRGLPKSGKIQAR